MFDVNKLLETAVRETAHIREGEAFLLKDLFKGYEWNRIDKSSRLLLGTLFLNHVNKVKGDVTAIQKNVSGQQRYVKAKGLARK